jgi:predicted nucleic acid-binding protein
LGALSVYLDANVIVPLFVKDVFSPRALAFMAGQPTGVIISDFASAEFVSVLGVRCRTKALTIPQARAALANFDAWVGANAVTAETSSDDIRSAESMLRRFDLALRTPDAIHIALAKRMRAELATLDERMAAGARALGVALAKI